MKNTNRLVLLVALFALAVVSIAGASALSISTPSVEINDAAVTDSSHIAAFAGDTLSVRVNFEALENASDVRIKAWISGDSSVSASTERFDIVAQSQYSKVLSVKVPSNINPTEEFQLLVSVENGGIPVEVPITLAAQRENYVVSFLDVAMDSKVNAGENLALDIVLKNRGSHPAEDTFVTVKIPALGISQRAYFGDLSAVDEKIENGDDDAAERVMNVRIPANVAPGIYDVTVEAFNSDADSTVTRKVAIDSGAGENTVLASAVASKNAAVGEKAEYSITLVNSGSNVRVYELALESASDALKLSASEPFVVVPAGTSKTVTVGAIASEAGTFGFTVKVLSNGEVAVEKDYALKAGGAKSTSVVANAGNMAVLLTVVLAIIFVVLLVVLIVLLTRKPQKVEEFGESYY